MRFIHTLCCTLLGLSGYAHALDVRGLIDVRVGATDATRSWTREGLDKSRFDRDAGNVRLGQAFLRIDGDLLDSVSASVVVSANDDRRRLLDLNEAWLSWNPVPMSAWKTRAKVGAFFPANNLEIDYDSIGWTPTRTISSSAINSWIGEEIRLQGIEVSLARKGNSVGSAHDLGVSAAAFGRNDPAGTLLAWRGWAISDRITGLTEEIRLADLPVFSPGGGLPAQSRSLRIAREIDHRIGYYVGVHYGHESWLRVEAMHYDNRGDPLMIRNGQYSWHTRFDQLNVRLRPSGAWLWLFQALRGETIMGPNAVRLRYDAWYALVSRSIGSGTYTVRYDRFRTREAAADILPSDPNSEHGQSLAVAHSLPLGPNISLIAEALGVRSSRVSRALIGDKPEKNERSLTASIRWRF